MSSAARACSSSVVAKFPMVILGTALGALLLLLLLTASTPWVACISRNWRSLAADASSSRRGLTSLLIGLRYKAATSLPLGPALLPFLARGCPPPPLFFPPLCAPAFFPPPVLTFSHSCKKVMYCGMFSSHWRACVALEAPLWPVLAATGATDAWPSRACICAPNAATDACTPLLSGRTVPTGRSISVKGFVYIAASACCGKLLSAPLAPLPAPSSSLSTCSCSCSALCMYCAR